MRIIQCIRNRTRWTVRYASHDTTMVNLLVLFAMLTTFLRISVCASYYIVNGVFCYYSSFLFYCARGSNRSNNGRYSLGKKSSLRYIDFYLRGSTDIFFEKNEDTQNYTWSIWESTQFSMLIPSMVFVFTLLLTLWMSEKHKDGTRTECYKKLTKWPY